MKRLTLTCEDCGRQKTFISDSALDILDKIDDSGWDHSAPTRGLCPECWTTHDNDGSEPG